MKRSSAKAKRNHFDRSNAGYGFFSTVLPGVERVVCYLVFDRRQIIMGMRKRVDYVCTILTRISDVWKCISLRGTTVFGRNLKEKVYHRRSFDVISLTRV